MRWLTFISAFVVLSGSSCRIIDPSEDIPSYIRIDSVTLSTSPDQGSNSQKITDAWIYVDNELIGAFELPCTVPVLMEGTHTISVRAGVKEDGMSTMRAIYSYYAHWQSSVTLVRGNVAEVSPVFQYTSTSHFAWKYDFEGSFGTYDDHSYNPFPGLVNIITNTDAFETSSGYVHLDANMNYCLLQSSDSFQLNPQSELWLEANYRCNQEFSIGLLNTSSTTANPELINWVAVAPSLTWNKIYVRFNDAIAGLPLTNYYKVFVRMQLTGQQSDGHYYFDNFKLVD